MTEVKILGKTYPMVYSVFAQNAIAKRVGGMDKIGAALQGPAEEVADNMAYMVAVMTKAAEQRARAECQIYGVEYEGETALSYEQLVVLLDVGDILEFGKAVIQTISVGVKQTVETVSDPKKDEATQSE